MQTVLDILKKTTGFFEGKGIDNARLNAELLLAKGLNCKRLDLYLRFNQHVVESQLQVLHDLVKRRGKLEPLQYIVGAVDFFDLTLKVDKRALIPRPETEELVARLVESWGANPPKRLLDLGTGSGAIALSLANKCTDIQVLAVDKSADALEVAQENAKLCNLEDRVTFIKSDWFEAVEGDFDFIISNPPYLTEEEWNTAQPEVKKAEPYSALVAEDAGMSDIKHILEESKKYMSTGSSLVLETGIAQHDQLAVFAESLGYSTIASWQDLSDRDRFFVVTV